MSDFHVWMREVDVCCIERFGVSIHDLPDMSFRDAFESDLSPEEFLDEADDEFTMLLGSRNIS